MTDVCAIPAMDDKHIDFDVNVKCLLTASASGLHIKTLKSTL
jgi:hypothetical protein